MPHHRDLIDARESAGAADAARRPQAAAPVPTVAETVLALQRSAGNSAVNQLMRAEATITDAERNRIRDARAFWMRLTGTPAREAPAAESAPAEIVEALPDAAPEGGGGEQEGGARESEQAGGGERPGHGNYVNPVEDGGGGGGERPGYGNYVNPVEDGGGEPKRGYGNYVNAVGGGGAAPSYDAPVSVRPGAARPAEPAAPVRPAKGWAGIRAAVKPAGPGPAKILPGREGPIKMLAWSQYWLEAIDPAHRPGHDLEVDFKQWKQSASDLTFWEWLDTNGTSSRQVNYMESQAERQKYMLLAKDGKLWQERKEYSTLTAYAPYGGASGWAIFVVSAAGVFYGAEAREGKFHHSTIMAGAAVRAAGEIRVEGGRLIGITPYSGHYRPGNDHLMYALQQLESRGVDIAGAAIAHVTDEGRKCTWFEAKDYLAHGENGKRIPRPAGHTKG